MARPRLVHRLRILFVVFLLPVAGAFASLPDSSPHADITRDAAKAAGWPAAATEALVTAVLLPDFEELGWAPEPDDPARYELEDDYQPRQHCIRFPGSDNETAFRRTLHYIHEHWANATNATDVQVLSQSLGKALHALQDCYSHTDYVDLDPEQQRQFDRAVLENASAPRVRLMASDPSIEEPGKPDDPYPHDHHAKDGPDVNAESQEMIGNRTKFQVAQDAATNASTVLLEDVWGSLSPAMRAALGSAGSVAAVPVWLVVAALAAACHGRNPKA